MITLDLQTYEQTQTLFAAICSREREIKNQPQNTQTCQELKTLYHIRNKLDKSIIYHQLDSIEDWATD